MVSQMNDFLIERPQELREIGANRSNEELSVK